MGGLREIFFWGGRGGGGVEVKMANWDFNIKYKDLSV